MSQADKISILKESVIPPIAQIQPEPGLQTDQMDFFTAMRNRPNGTVITKEFNNIGGSGRTKMQFTMSAPYTISGIFCMATMKNNIAAGSIGSIQCLSNGYVPRVPLSEKGNFDFGANGAFRGQCTGVKNFWIEQQYVSNFSHSQAPLGDYVANFTDLGGGSYTRSNVSMAPLVSVSPVVSSIPLPLSGVYVAYNVGFVASTYDENTSLIQTRVYPISWTDKSVVVECETDVNRTTSCIFTLI